MTLEVLDVSRKVLVATMESSGSQAVVRWRRGGDVSQAEPGTPAKGHLADRTFLSISISSLLG
jgi:hypothetical protein